MTPSVDHPRSLWFEYSSKVVSPSAVELFSVNEVSCHGTVSAKERNGVLRSVVVTGKPTIPAPLSRPSNAALS